MNPENDNRQLVKDSEELFNFLADQVPQFIWMTGPEEINLVYSNQPFLQFLGLSSQEQFLGTAWEKYMHPEDVPKVVEIYGKAFKTKTPYSLEGRFWDAASNGYCWFLIHGMPRLDRAGQFSGFIGTAVDISAFKRIQQAVDDSEQKANGGLDHERIKQLERSNEDLLQLARVTSHDLREPVRKIQVFLERFSIELNKGDTENARVYLGKVQGSAQRMATVIDGILNYSVVNDQAQAIEKISLNDLLKTVVTDLEILILQKKAIVLYDTLPDVYGVPTMIYQLFYNLIGNAVKFGKTDGLAVIAVGGAVVREVDMHYAELFIKDNGIGFRQEDAERMFQMQVRLDTKDSYEGWGIGLALCKKIVDRHGGRITARGAVGEGAEFIFRLPMEQGVMINSRAD